MIVRRNFLVGLGASSIALTANVASARSVSSGINANSEGLRAGAVSDQGKKLQKIVDVASKNNQAVFIEPGRYKVSNLTLPKNTRLHGINGATKLEYAGGDHFLYAENANHVELDGISLDGSLLPVKDYAEANLGIVNVKHVSIQNCNITNASKSGIEVSNSAGRISKNQIDTAVGTAGIVGQANTGLMISDNVVSECANAGILVYRRDVGADNTIITNNRVKFISAVMGGTGQYGNGINTWQADGVMISNNHISDCAFSSIRSNSCSNIQITNNTCLRAWGDICLLRIRFSGCIDLRKHC